MDVVNAAGESGPAPFLAALELRLADALRPAAGVTGRELAETARQLVLAPAAKRARPLLCRTIARLWDLRDESVLPVAAAVELIHSASLLHDDVVDESPTRRGVPTANALKGNSFAVLTGDLVLARALALLAPLGPAVVSAATECLVAMTVAARREVELRGQVVVDEETWREVAAGKTAALFQLCGSALCALAGDDARAARLEKGLGTLGVTFQLADDVADLVGVDGKPAFQDLREKNPSFPLVLAARDPSLRRELETLWNPAVPDEAALLRFGEKLRRGPVARAAVDAALTSVNDARDALAEDAGALGDVLAWAEAHVTGVARRLS